MSLMINTNLSSIIVQSSLKKSTNSLNQAIERMSTGLKINAAKDNAAGYSISRKMDIKLSSLDVALDNVMLGSTLVETASSNLSLITSHLQRIRDLAEQAANGTYGVESLSAIQSEVDARSAEINRVISNTQYNGIKLFEGDTNGEQAVTGDFISQIIQLSEDEALAQGYTLIKTAEDLDNIRNDLSGKYILMNDIDLSKISNWEPIGGESDIFTGELNGNGHVIKNLKINTQKEYGALITQSTGIIKNLGLENANIKVFGSDSSVAAGIAGAATEIENCYVKGNIESNGSSSGLVVMLGDGQSYTAGSIKNSYFIGKVTGYVMVGGMVGVSASADENNKSLIENCFSSGSVTGEQCVGGLYGGYIPYVSIKNSYSSSTVTGDNSVGGLAGALIGYIENSYSTGKVIGNSNTGGLIGYGASLIITNSYYDKTTSGQSVGIGEVYNLVVGNVDGVTTSELNDLINAGTLNKITPIPGKNDIGRDFTLQVGIDSSEYSTISFNTSFNMDFSIDLTTNAGAVQAIEDIDNLLLQVSNKQTEFGAVQNRLDSVLESLSINIENLTSSKSTITDADIATDSSEYIRNQILQQASATLLATANQTPSIALQLL